MSPLDDPEAGRSAWWDPRRFEELAEGVSRRTFMKLAGASLALAGLAGCRRPVEKIVPYLSAPEESVLGSPEFYASALPLGLSVWGVLVESHEGRPTKIEGNPRHPATRGGSNVFMQAAILGLYDPDRSRFVKRAGATSTWEEFVEFRRAAQAQWSANGGAGLAILSESFSSPTLTRLRGEFLRRYPRATWVAWDPVGDENLIAGVRRATGRNLRPLPHYDRARIILALDADFLGSEGDPAPAADFAAGRRLSQPSDETNRLYAVESALTLTGAMADHRLAVKPSRIAALTQALAAELGVGSTASLGDVEATFVQAVAANLLDHRGSSLIVAGRRQPPEVHALALALNEALGNLGRCLEFAEIRDAALPDTAGLIELTRRLRAGEVDTLIVLGGNPVYNAPADLDFAGALVNASTTVHLSLYEDETSRRCKWHLPQAHFLESWGDARAADGTIGVVQPLTEPLHGGRTAVEVLNLLATGENTAGYTVVRRTWEALLPTAGAEAAWNRVLHDGLLDGSAATPVMPTLNRQIPQPASPAARGELEVVFAPDHALWDGRFANNAWLQELPDPVTKITWDNAAQISPETARRLSVASGQTVGLRLESREISAPVWVQPGIADDTVVLALGYGRTAAGSVGNGVGYDAYRLRTTDRLHAAAEAVIEATAARHTFAITQEQRTQVGRPMLRIADLEDYRRDPHFAQEAVETPPLKSLWNEHSYDTGYQWGMVIDLDLCTGCAACVIACQSENNIPVVGKRQVAKGREMGWLRVDGYYLESSAEGPARLAFQPVPCMHCEMAPCEQVCPVAATVHNPEGLNLMTYNRCVGTRYCSNNCPYKVRRFNFFNYTKQYTPTVRMAQNPDVTVRSRGVMEKCSYCVQRIQEARRQARLENRDIRDGEFTTACAQACPTGAIVFGNLNDPATRAATLRRADRNYALLAEYNTRPRTTYLARVRNRSEKLR